MAIQPEIKDAIERNMELMLTQTKSYLPFLKVAFPGAKNLSEMCYNLMVGNALTTFLTQYALRMKSPEEGDFAEFGLVVEKYRSKINEVFK